MKKFIFALAIGIIAILTTSVVGPKVTEAATSRSVVTASSAKTHTPATTNMMYISFGADLGPYCVAAQKTNGQVIIFNGARTVKLRYNFALPGYDRIAINAGKWVAIDPRGVLKIATAPCLFVP